MFTCRDIKLENVLLDADGNAKLSDFGLGALPHSTRDDGLLRTSCGTPNYVSPEVLARRGYDGILADIWSLGEHPLRGFLASVPFRSVLCACMRVQQDGIVCACVGLWVCMGSHGGCVSMHMLVYECACACPRACVALQIWWHDGYGWDWHRCVPVCDGGWQAAV